MNQLLQEAKDMADEIDLIQPGTSVAHLLRRLAAELYIQRKHYEHATGFGKGATEGSAGGTDDRGPDVSPGGEAGAAMPRKVKPDAGEGR